MFKILFLALLLFTVSYAEIDVEMCEGDWDVTVTKLDYQPHPSFVIGDDFSYEAYFTVSKEVAGGTIRAQVWVNDFSDDPWIDTTDDLCRYFDCPMTVGDHVRKDWNINIPSVPQGQYELKLTVMDPEDNIVSCVIVTASVTDSNNPTPTNCNYPSDMDWSMEANNIAQYEKADPKERVKGTWIQVGDLGPHTTGDRGKFSKLIASEDNTFGEVPNSNIFEWCLNGTVTKRESVDAGYEITYEADVWIGAKNENMDTWDEYYMRGNVEFTGTWDISDDHLSALTGNLNFDPTVHMPPSWAGPVSYGKLNPIPLEFKSTSNLVLAQKDTTVCQCEIDDCGVCGGDGQSCITPTPTATPTPSPTTDTKSDDNNNTIIAVSVIVPIAAIVIIIIVILLLRQRKQKKTAQTEIISANRFGNTGMSWSQITKDNVKSTFSKSGSTGATGNDEEGSDDDFSFDPTDDDSLEDLDDSD
ncbi:niemann pick type c2 protein npc2-related [Anaeramoeba flamelloides]|uniref:Niemann pick type c2 protein npc2-related n=1 Tax=Anaeramoeba flamelloides TaxID=1746091 RepID=A0ABQ8X8B1_9EUKA|nr:niemann pick type c2 protein npc2-related [Anaeramoeba flamelloides]